MQLTDDTQLELFDPSRWPRKPYCSNDLTFGLKIRALKSAIKYPYIQANPPHLMVWLIHDIDRPGAALAWEKANLPEPSWTAVNRKNGHAHLCWGLKTPVLTDGDGMHLAPLRYLAAIESLMREKLQADEGFSGQVTKNPANPLWRTRRGSRLAYDLHEIAEYLPELSKHKPKKRDITAIGLGRNVVLFEFLRSWAYRNVREYRGGGERAWDAWLSKVNNRALLRNADFKTPLDGKEVWYIAKSVAKWTYRKFDIDESDKKFSALQTHRIQQRWGNNEEKRASARLMAAKGLTNTAIAAELDVTRRTIIRWLSS